MGRDTENSFDPTETRPRELTLSELSDEQVLAMDALDAKETGRNNYGGRIPNWEKFARIVLNDPSIKISDPEDFDKVFSERLGQIALAILDKEVPRDEIV